MTVDTREGLEPVAWQYRVMFDEWHPRGKEWCDWRDAGKKYFDKVNADIAAGATRVQTRALYASPSPELPAGGQAVDGAAPKPLSFFSENVDSWSAAEWFNRLATAIRQQDKAVLAHDDVALEICRNVAASSALHLVRDHEKQVRAALAPHAEVQASVIEECVKAIEDLKIKHAGKYAGAGYRYMMQSTHSAPSSPPSERKTGCEVTGTECCTMCGGTVKHRGGCINGPAVSEREMEK